MKDDTLAELCLSAKEYKSAAVNKAPDYANLHGMRFEVILRVNDLQESSEALLDDFLLVIDRLSLSIA